MAKSSQRAMWSGAITFGLVTIPVKLYSVIHEETVHFHMLHDQDHARLKRKMVCSVDEKEVHPEHIVKGYEIAPDQYVIVEQEELEAVQPKKSRTIEIEDFVQIDEIDPIYFDRPYYLVPQETGTKPYRLLVDAMEQSGRVGVARFVMRNKEYLTALRPKDGALVMETMHFHSEVLPISELEEVPRTTKTDERQLKMAQQLIDSLSGKFKPEKYHDEYVRHVREMVERKAAGQKIVTAPEASETGGRTTNLLEALQASLQRARSAAREDAPAKDNPDERPARTHSRSRPRKKHPR